jgi:hypothetical protein
MKMNKLAWAYVAMSMVVPVCACKSNSDAPPAPAATGGQGQGGSGGKGGQGGQTSTTGTSTGGTSGQGGKTTESGGTPGGTGGRSGSGGLSGGGAGGLGGQGGTATDTRADAAALGGAGGQGGNTSKPPADDAAAPGTGGAAGGDAGSTAGPEVAAPDAAVGNPKRVLLSDEGNRRVVLVDLQNPSAAVWSRSLGDTTKYGDSMRDLQLVGNDRVAVSVLKGYVELDIKTGEIKKEVTSFDGVESIRRLPSGNTVLGSNSNGGVTLQEIDAKDAAVANRKVTFTNYSQLRLMRRTPQGTFLLGVGAKLAEVNWDKQTVWEMSIPDGNYVFQGLRLPSGNLAATSGYGVAILVIDPSTKKVLTTVGGKSQPDATTIVPNFYGGFQVLPNGHFVVTNWEGHGGGNGGKGIQLLEYDSAGLLVWKWKQEPSLVSSLHDVIVLDGLDTTKLHDDVGGVLAPVSQ